MVFQAMIRKELNEFKSTEMDVHEESKQFTRSVIVALFAFTTVRMVPQAFCFRAVCP